MAVDVEDAGAKLQEGDADVKLQEEDVPVGEE